MSFWSGGPMVCWCSGPVVCCTFPCDFAFWVVQEQASFSTALNLEVFVGVHHCYTGPGPRKGKGYKPNGTPAYPYAFSYFNRLGKESRGAAFVQRFCAATAVKARHKMPRHSRQRLTRLVGLSDWCSGICRLMLLGALGVCPPLFS